MKCPECDNELKVTGTWSIVGSGKNSIKLKQYVCYNRDCEAYYKIWYKSLETGEAIDPPLTTKHLDKLEKH